jgi:hypothetical protein
VAAEIACQQRMVGIPSAADTSPQAHRVKGMPAAFETMSRRYAAMDLDGCTDDQRGRVPILVRVTHELATLASRLPRGGAPDEGSAAPSPAFLQFVDRLQDFEQRRQAMQQDLDRMRAVRLR